MNNVSLDETLFYQYMINNNSTSTMLNALNGGSSDDSSNSLTSAIGSMYSMGNLGTGSISDVSTILGLLGNNYSGGVSSLDSFSNILQTYLNQDSSQAAEMMEKLEGVLEETAGTEEEGTKSWKTVQELYEYFAEMTSGQANNLLGILSPDSKKETTSGESQSSMGSAVIDFDAIEQESDTMIDSLMEETGYQF